MTYQWKIENYMIAFLDVLGQSDEVLRLSRPPITEEELKDAEHILSNTADCILDLRSAFERFFEDDKSSPFDGLPIKHEIVQKWRLGKAEFRGLSDSIVITLPLANDTEDLVPLMHIYSSLQAICEMFVIALQRGKPFRGSIDIGWGVRLPQNEVYGSALVKAINLEHKVAQYPRVIIGNSMWEYLNSVEALDSNTEQCRVAKSFARDSKKFITIDYDGIRILDVIGSQVNTSLRNCQLEHIRNSYESCVKKSYEFIVATHDRLSRAEDMKLLSMYGWLRSYFESRLHLWNIQPIQSSK